MAHALLSPSSSHRWLHCTSAPSLERDMPDGSSVYAEEGTLAHAICEAKLRELRDGVTAEDWYKRQEGTAWTEHPLYKAEMEETTDYYRDVVAQKWLQAKSISEDAELLIEVALDFGAWIPGGFGTADALIACDGEINVIDYKHGKGVEVSAQDNTQMMIYALGACKVYGLEYDIRNVCMTIVQPRIDNTSVWSIPKTLLYKWADEVLIPKAQEAYSGTLGCETHTEVGEWCKFCKAKAICRAKVEASLKMLGKGDPRLIANDEIAELLPKAKLLQDWYADLEAHALSVILNGEKIEGYKVVAGRSNRKISEPMKLAEILTAEGLDDTMIYRPRELRTLGDLEKMVGKARFGEIAQDCIVKPMGAPTLVKSSDKRQEYSVLTSDFSHILNFT